MPSSSSCTVLHHRHGLIRALPKLSSSVFQLIGPSEIYETRFPPPPTQPPPTTGPSNSPSYPTTASPFMDLMVKNFNKPPKPSILLKG
ncbi:hypothetical protein MKX03_005352, partial [Papaver bracteatum]